MSRHRTPIYSFLLALLATPAWAIEPPAEEAAPPAPPAVDEKQPAVQADPVKDVAYLGIVSGPIPKALSVHLGVRNGEGVIVRSVMPEGPAEKAGIQTHDIILTVDDTPAFSPEDLSKAIASKQPDDEVKIGLIQRGEGSELVVRLGKRPDAIAQGPNREDLAAPGIGPFGEELLRNMLNGRMHGL
ncbi:MAG: PDZ domain-containing protein, partial [Akkermansiaceae bacterium]|nr:PDZ domain-containing protein [Akkermansiaceae bacterium]